MTIAYKVKLSKLVKQISVYITYKYIRGMQTFGTANKNTFNIYRYPYIWMLVRHKYDKYETPFKVGHVYV
jgi:hypothetical protein